MSEELTGQEQQQPAPKQERMDRRPVIPNLPPDRATLNAEQFKTFAAEFARRTFADPAVAEKILSSALIIRFMYYDELWGDEDISVTINCRATPVEITVGPSDLEPDVAMKMHADLAHKFWMQKLNLTMAVARSWVLVKGAIPKLMRLIPFIKPGYTIYRLTLADMGHHHLLNYPDPVAEQQSEAQQSPEPAQDA